MSDSSLANIIRNGAEAHPDKPAIICAETGNVHTYSALDENSNRVANALLALGIKADDRIAVLAKNTPQHFELLFGVAKIGAAFVGVNWRLSPSEAAAIVADSGAKFLLFGNEYAALLDQITLPAGCQALVLDGVSNNFDSYADWIANASISDSSNAVPAQNTCLHFYSSGTTGLPKGIELTNQNMKFLLAEGMTPVGADDNTVMLICGPLFHIGACGMSLLCLHNGGTVVLMKEVNLDQMVDLIPRYQATFLSLVPAMIRMLLNRPDIREVDLSSVKTIGYGASPIAAADLVEAKDVFKCDFVQAYGMTESAGLATILLPEDHISEGDAANLLNSCGRAAPGIELSIHNPETGEPLAEGDVGEIWMRGPNVMKSYWHNEAETEKALAGDGWLRSGDAGYLQNGYLYISDRIKDMIISGGENIYPAEVENVLMEHPHVKDVAVIGVPHPKWGETVKAIVVANDQAVDSEELIEFCRQRIARYKCPTSADWVEEIPRSAAGKIMKKELREQYQS